jgi:hypothetical protein
MGQGRKRRRSDHQSGKAVGTSTGGRDPALPAERIMGVETGGCPRTAIRQMDTLRMRHTRPFVFASLNNGDGVERITEFVVD